MFKGSFFVGTLQLSLSTVHLDLDAIISTL
jgi:hypothetical protein